MSEPQPRARLLCRSGRLVGRSFQLGAETRIGRDPSNEIVLELPAVSKRHARIVHEDGRYILEDLNSTHGTRLDGVAIEAPTPLTRMHVIELSDVELVFTPAPARGIAPAGQSADPAPAPEEPADAQSDPSDGPGPGADERGTMVDAGSFGTLPDLDRGTSHESEGGEGDDDRSGTIVDAAGFDALPELDRDGGAEPDEPAVRYEIEVDLPDSGPAIFPLAEGDNIVGRGEDCDIKIVDPAMWLSRKHVILRVKEDGVELVDLKGVNGTFVDGRRIDTAMLEPGSTFVLGPHLEFKLQAR